VSVSPVPTPRPTAAVLVLVGAIAVAPWAAALLFALSRFGQSPPETLPWAVVLLLGALLAAPAAAAAAHLPRGGAAASAGIGAAAAVAAVVLAGLPAAYLGAVPATLATLALLRALPGQRPELYGAALVYVGCTVLANFTLDSFIPLGDFFLINVGTLFFGVTFTQRDRLHRFGRRVVYRVILLAAGANVSAAWAVGTPLRYVAVSFLAIVISEAADTEVYHRLLHRRWFTRVAGSNAVSAPLDTILFTTLAFAGAPFATAAWMTQVIVTDVFVKYGASLVAAITLMSRPEWVPKAPPAVDARGGELDATVPAPAPPS
jgi:queuosine precursor transporter